MRRPLLAALLALLAPACVSDPDHPPGRGSDTDPDAMPGISECGIPILHVQGAVTLALARTSTGDGCPFVYDRPSYALQADDTATPPFTSADASLEITGAYVDNTYTDRAIVQLATSDEWGVGPTSDQLEHARGAVALDLTFHNDGSIDGGATGTVDYQGVTCTITYEVTGSYTPEWR